MELSVQELAYTQRAVKNIKAKVELQKLNAVKPVEQMPTEITKNQELADLRSKTGLPSEQYVMAMKSIQQQQDKTLKSAGDRRMALGLLPSIDDNANRAKGNLNAQNANARLNNEKTLMNVNSSVASWKTAKANRELAQWNNKMDYARAVEGSANQNRVNAIMSGINTVGAIAGSAYQNGNNTSWANGLFGNSNKVRRYRTGVGGDPNGGNLRLNSDGQLLDANGNIIQ